MWNRVSVPRSSSRIFGNWLQNPGLVVGVHDADEQRVGPQPAGDARVRRSRRGLPGLVDVKASRGMRVERLQHRLVFDGGGEDMPAAGFLGRIRRPRRRGCCSPVAPLVKKTSSGAAFSGGDCLSGFFHRLLSPSGHIRGCGCPH